MKQAIARADALVVLLTKDGQASSYVQQEIGFAEAKGKLIVPLVEPGVSEQGLAMLQGREYIPFDLNNPAPALASLLNYLTRLKTSKEESQGALAFIGLLVWNSVAQHYEVNGPTRSRTGIGRLKVCCVNR